MSKDDVREDHLERVLAHSCRTADGDGEGQKCSGELSLTGDGVLSSDGRKVRFTCCHATHYWRLIRKYIRKSSVDLIIHKDSHPTNERLQTLPDVIRPTSWLPAKRPGVLLLRTYIQPDHAHQVWLLHWEQPVWTCVGKIGAEQSVRPVSGLVRESAVKGSAHHLQAHATRVSMAIRAVLVVQTSKMVANPSHDPQHFLPTWYRPGDKHFRADLCIDKTQNDRIFNISRLSRSRRSIDNLSRVLYASVPQGEGEDIGEACGDVLVCDV